MSGFRNSLHHSSRKKSILGIRQTSCKMHFLRRMPSGRFQITLYLTIQSCSSTGILTCCRHTNREKCRGNVFQFLMVFSNELPCFGGPISHVNGRADYNSGVSVQQEMVGKSSGIVEICLVTLVGDNVSDELRDFISLSLFR